MGLEPRPVDTKARVLLTQPCFSRVPKVQWWSSARLSFHPDNLEAPKWSQPGFLATPACLLTLTPEQDGGVAGWWGLSLHVRPLTLSLL